MTEAIQVATTTGNQEDARRIADALIDRRLAACVQISGPIESRYRWQGKIECDEEWLLTAKSRLNFYQRVETTIRELHPYDEPEILATPVVAGSEGYLRWLDAELDA